MFRDVSFQDLCVILGFSIDVIDMILVLLVIFEEFGVLIGFGFEEFVFGEAFGFESRESIIGSIVKDLLVLSLFKGFSYLD